MGFEVVCSELFRERPVVLGAEETRRVRKCEGELAFWLVEIMELSYILMKSSRCVALNAQFFRIINVLDRLRDHQKGQQGQEFEHRLKLFRERAARNELQIAKPWTPW
jgi:hypothetical protein